MRSSEAKSDRSVSILETHYLPLVLEVWGSLVEVSPLPLGVCANSVQCKNCRTFAWYPQITGELLGMETAHIWCEKCCEYRNIFLYQPSIQKMCLSASMDHHYFGHWGYGSDQNR